jgi:hypothetical protein
LTRGSTQKVEKLELSRLSTNDRREEKRREEKRKMDPPIKSEDDGVWVSENDRVLVSENDRVWVMTISMGLYVPRWLNKSFQAIYLGQPWAVLWDRD